MNPSLPILDNPATISYSALNDWHYCPYFYLLADIKRLKPWKNSADTIFGTYIHSAVQDVLSDIKTVEEATKVFNRKWKKLCGLYKKFLDDEDIAFGLSAPQIIANIKPALTAEFGKFTVLKVEEKLALPAGEKWPQKFKGYIDIVLQLENGKIVIVDFKTAGSSFFFAKYQDKYKDYQLTLYKHFYCKKNGTNPDDIETYFVVLEKNHKSKKPITTIRVTSGDVKVENALKWLEFALSAINRKVFIKNRSNCLKFGEAHPCVFYKTTHCP